MKTLINKIISDDIDIPSQPQTALEILSLIEDDNISLNKLQELMQSDQQISATILKISNAPIYNTGKSIKTITEAINHLGLHTIAAIVSMISITNLVTGGKADKTVIDHSLTVSKIASSLSNHTKKVSKEEAFIAGTLHDIGKNIMNVYIPDKYKRVKDLVFKEGKSFYEAEDEILGYNHCQVGYILAKKWKFPNQYAYVIKHHHDIIFKPKIDQTVIKPEEALCYLIRIADILSFQLEGISTYDEYLETLLDKVGITKNTFDKVKDSFSSRL
ncbi:MAG: HDOD domain-containing protein [Thermodesulfovibrionales bacterium]|nr:HDOD domain-containing protein [Thermodesulfovibrionales bacterium]